MIVSVFVVLVNEWQSNMSHMTVYTEWNIYFLKTAILLAHSFMYHILIF